MLGAQALELTQRLAGRPTQLGMMTFALELGEHGQRQHHGVLVEPEQRLRIGQDDGRVDDVRLLSGTGPARMRAIDEGWGSVTELPPDQAPRRSAGGSALDDEQLAREADVVHVHDASGADGSLPIMKHPHGARWVDGV